MTAWLTILPLTLVEALLRSGPLTTDYCPPLSRSGTSALTSARDRDILLCLVSCSLQLGVRRLTVPASLVLDECSRWPLTITSHLSVRLR